MLFLQGIDWVIWEAGKLCCHVILGHFWHKVHHTTGKPSTVLGVLQESADANSHFQVLQPGSSVATALSEGEAQKKHVMVLEVLGSQFRVQKHALNTVRPFIFDKASA